MDKLSDRHIIQSWQDNADAWIQAIQHHEIKSRITTTNQAILDAVLTIKPHTVLDIGCGEGWLVRELTRQGIDTLGIDAVQSLIDYANRFGEGRFMKLAYEDLAQQQLYEHFDLAVANFSLLGKDSVEHVFEILPDLLNPNGHFVVQTLHPIQVCGDADCEDGWCQTDWEGFNDRFRGPATWYFRTPENWRMLFTQNRFKLVSTTTPLDRETGVPASLLMIGQGRD